MSRTPSATLTRRSFLAALGLSAAGLAGCSGQGADDASQAQASSSSESSVSGTAAIGTNPDDMSALTIDSAAWRHDADNDIYYQLGVSYCAHPEATGYESMGIYVPGAYLTAVDNGDGTYTCSVYAAGSLGDYTATTAPVVMPVNTAGYSAQEAPTEYSAQGITDYLSAGLVYVYAGCRGRANGTNADGSSFAGGAPWGVTDLKAAVRCLRYNADVLPGDTNAIFTFGHSGGGAQSALMGATGDSTLYVPYLEHIGAAMTDDDGTAISDAVRGAMCWCPITSLDVADEAYEWMMGQYATGGTRADGTFTAALSDDLAQSFVDWVNEAGLEHEGEVLSLSDGGEGVGTSGSYYDYVLSEVERSLGNFLSDTTFPYTPSDSFSADGGFGGGGAASGGEAPSGEAPSGSGAPSGEAPTGTPPSGTAPGGDAATSDAGDAGSSESTTYDTVEDYVDALNADEQWVSYDTATNTATVSGLGAFVRACKPATKDVCAFDALDRSQAENDLFGTSEQDSAHFDSTLAGLLSENATTYAALSDWDDSYPDSYAADLALTDDLGTSMATRAALYNPLAFLLDSYDESGSSTPAPHWRIRTGIEQGDTSLTTELDLALALEADPRVEDVDFETVWGLGHTTAERTGDATTNLIAWVAGCMG